MRVWYDTEFLEDGRTIELISIGMVAEDGREYYAVNADMPVDAVREHDWLRENVWPHLPVNGLRTALRTVGGQIEQFVETPGFLDTSSTLVRPLWVIRNEVREFLVSVPDLELWAWYAAYDHVALAQLFGRMINLPKGIPMYTHDLKQEVDRLGNPTLPTQQADEHNALADARWVRDAHRWLETSTS